MGGCRPTAKSAVRMRMALSRLSPNASTVALPMGVSPLIVNLSLDQIKCDFHICRRGWKRDTSSPEAGSLADTSRPFLLLQWKQASARLSSVFVPPIFMGIMWSTVNRTYCHCSNIWQYSHRNRARSRILV